MTGHHQVVKVRRGTLVACMTCQLCNKLLKEATTISECLHTFCRKCIYDKLTDEDVDCCPICNIDLGCAPEEKLRPDHNLEDVRAKIFPLKRRIVKAPEVPPTIQLPVKRKERSLSSLVVSTPRVSPQPSLTGRRTKGVARKAASLRGSSFVVDEHVEKEENLEDQPESSSSPETLSKIAQNRRQPSSSAEQSNHHVSGKDKENIGESWGGKVDLWKPLTCLVEAANRTNSSKSSSQGSVVKLEQANEPPTEVRGPKTKGRGLVNKSKAQDSSNGANSTSLSMAKPRKLQRMRRKRAESSGEHAINAQTVLDAVGSNRDKRTIPIWFTLVASEDQEGDAPLPQIDSCYLRIRDVNIPVLFIQKYLMKKLDLQSEVEVEICCRGQPVVPTLQLHNLMDLWLQTATSSSHRISASVGSSAKDFVMVLAYSRKVQAS